MIKRTFFIVAASLILLSSFPGPVCAEWKYPPKPELNKKRDNPDYILEKYTDIFKTGDYGNIIVGPPFVTLQLAGIDFSEYGLGRKNLRSVLQIPEMYPLRVFVIEENKKRYNTRCAILVSQGLKTTVQDVLIKEGFVKASDKCLETYPHYIEKFKKDEAEAKAAKKGIWANYKEEKK